MAPHIFPTDEELGKRDDDYAPGKKASPAWRNLPYSYRRRRIAVIVGAALFVWLLLRVISSGDPDYLVYDASSPTKPVKPKGAPPKVAGDIDNTAAQHYYSGRIKFFELGDTLHKISNTNGMREKNRNVLFAASNLKSVSALLPLACEMAKWNRNHVHFVIMGRYDIPLDDILEVNGIDREGCDVYWHDARPDYVTYSSDARAEAIVMAALGHIQTFMHPQVVITDDPIREDPFFSKGMQRKTKDIRLPVIELPKNRADNLEWLTRLDSSSLRHWHAPSIDILIHAPQKSSGSLLRLLKSIKDADYSGLTPPRITVELPADIDPPSIQYLEQMAWPPAPKDPFVRPRQNGLTIRHRIPDQRASSEESSVRFLESFYPSQDAHVLLLAPNAQLSPLYYQYLMFHLLEYRYSTYAHIDNTGLLGLSLELPPFHLNGSTALEPPTTADMRDDKYKHAGRPEVTVPFQWQAPNSNAALYFGDRWTEIHSFLSNRLAAFRRQADPVTRPRTIHESLPGWLEYFLELMRARGYALHYPGLDPAHALVSMHTELYQPPEEMLAEIDRTHDGEAKAAEDDVARKEEKDASPSPFLSGDPAAALDPPDTPEPQSLDTEPLHLVLRFDADLPELRALPRLSHQGLLVESEDAVAQMAEEVTRKFRKSVGGCGAGEEPEGMRRVRQKGSARDLFCFGDEGMEAWEVVKGEDGEEDEEDEGERKKGGGGEKDGEGKEKDGEKKESKTTYMGEPLEKSSGEEESADVDGEGKGKGEGEKDEEKKEAAKEKGL
ncbi:hypothetical protein MPH_09454 [Macrophomina phaseolina MS6]|uniref:Uncharacterized protein n=1 Tax=Macrophomina phaseolina (strain MS6) TaxID=1126212 RepID=K2RFQ3_MACPH|nr:hypothetical protein MPH_09454 [Macrophomina phaseolina MS6]